ncbi:MAG: cyclase family protein [Alphaproteobacteria bacterium]|jgi:kynurenine formamidase|nr:cyclase family protein [Alphaproteobacteria bacterium]
MKFPYKIIDLTHTMSPDIPTWNDSCTFEHDMRCDYDPDAEYKFRAFNLHMAEGIGTHIDSPSHCISGGKTVDQLDLENLGAPCVVIDVSSRAHERYSASVSDITDFEDMRGVIEPGSFVIVRTGWERFWGQPDQYRNNRIFPSISVEAAQYLLKRQIVGIGIDALSPDRFEDGFPVHKCLLGAGKYIVENIANSASLPPKGSYTLALPIKIGGGAEAPIRLIALCERGD